MIKSFTYQKILITIDNRLKEVRLINNKQDMRFFKISEQENNCLMFCNDDNFYKRLLRDILKENGFSCYLTLLSEVKK